MRAKYEIIALDVDGTLLNDQHELTIEVKEAVREAAKQGAQIVLCTGRGPISALPVLDELGLGGILIAHNGAATILAENKTILHEYTMEPEHLIKYMDYCRKWNVHYDLNTAFEMMVEQLTPEAEEMYGKFLAMPSILKAGEELPDGLLKFTAFGTKERMDQVQAEWEQWPSELQPIRSGDYFIDVQHSEASKGMALKQLALSRRVEASKIMAIGNYYNDVTMLQYAGLGIAMDNSPDEVKAAAQAIAPSNNDNGVAKALYEYALQGK